MKCRIKTSKQYFSLRGLRNIKYFVLIVGVFFKEQRVCGEKIVHRPWEPGLEIFILIINRLCYTAHKWDIQEAVAMLQCTVNMPHMSRGPRCNLMQISLCVTVHYQHAPATVTAVPAAGRL